MKEAEEEYNIVQKCSHEGNEKCIISYRWSESIEAEMVYSIMIESNKTNGLVELVMNGSTKPHMLLWWNLADTLV